MSDSFKEQAAALKETKEANHITIIEYAMAMQQLERQQQM